MTATASRQPAVSRAGEAAMDSVDSYAARVLSIIRPLPSRPLRLAEADGAVLPDLGTVSFGKVAMQPGMPPGFGTAGPAGTPIITLPGNPVSAFVSFRLFVTPAVRALQGLRPLELYR